jgi:hypothetical protein
MSCVILSRDIAVNRLIELIGNYERERGIRSLNSVLDESSLRYIIEQTLSALPNRECIGIQGGELHRSINKIYNYKITTSSITENLRYGTPSDPGTVTASFVRRVLKTESYLEASEEINMVLDDLEKSIDDSFLVKFNADHAEYLRIIHKQSYEADDNSGSAETLSPLPVMQPIVTGHSSAVRIPVTKAAVSRTPKKSATKPIVHSKKIETMNSAELKEYLQQKGIKIPVKGSGSNGNVLKSDLLKVVLEKRTQPSIKCMTVPELKGYLQEKGIKIPVKGSGSGGSIIKSDLLKLACAKAGAKPKAAALPSSFLFL